MKIRNLLLKRPHIVVNGPLALLMIAALTAATAFAIIDWNSPSSGTATVHGPTSGTLTATQISFGNGTAPISCTVSANAATCPAVQVTVNGSPTESASFTVTVTFTASPPGSTILVDSTGTTGILTANSPSQTTTATGASQTVTSTFTAAGPGSSNWSVTLVG